MGRSRDWRHGWRYLPNASFQAYAHTSSAGVLLVLLVLSPLSVAGAELQDATGRSIRIPDQPIRVLPAGPPAAVLLASPSSRFASELKNKPWYEVLQEPGIKIGRTDPEFDPNGALTVQLLDRAEQIYKLPKCEFVVCS